jgi:hypothetical protein
LWQGRKPQVKPEACNTNSSSIVYVLDQLFHKELNLKELALLDDGGEGGHLLEDGLPVLGVATAG